ncbi:MAG: gamma-glutamyltransferase [Alphaproteobacteria bacterium]|nr:gamma-glutamyltransferase [Alphaproteobacteria bacterium]
MVVAANPLAAEAGRAILRQGGSAVDAAIATQLVLNLVEPQSSGIGGGGFLLHYAAASGSMTVYDGRETAPAAATPGALLGALGQPRRFSEVVVGGLSVGVPGLLRALELAHRDHGRLPWAALFAPAIALTEKGFPISPRLHALVSEDPVLATIPAARTYFYDSGGRPLAVGTLRRNPELAAVLRQVATAGADAFYRGAVARDIALAVRTANRNPGRLAVADLAGYAALRREPLCRNYRAWRLCGLPPPSSGGVTLFQILALLEPFDLSHLQPGSVAAVHLIAEASRLAFADRARYLADPAFIPVPVAGLLDPGYLAERRRAISLTRSMGPAAAGEPPGQRAEVAPDPTPDRSATTHLSIVDEAGNAVALTSSIESAFGSRLFVHGFLLNNQITDFSFRPDEGGRPVGNRMEPGKRPRSSMAPTLVFDRDARLVMVVGSPGGKAIIGYVAQALIAVLDWNLDIQSAVNLPHYINTNDDTELEAGTDIAGLAGALSALGHEVEITELTSGLHAIKLDGKGLAGGADPRREGVALGD